MRWLIGSILAESWIETRLWSFGVLPKVFMVHVRMPILRRFGQVTHIWYMITKFFTSPKHDFTCLGRVHVWFRWYICKCVEKYLDYILRILYSCWNVFYSFETWFDLDSLQTDDGHSRIVAEEKRKNILGMLHQVGFMITEDWIIFFPCGFVQYIK